MTTKTSYSASHEHDCELFLGGICTCRQALSPAALRAALPVNDDVEYAEVNDE